MTSKQQPSTNRSGAALVAALICLLIVSMIVGAMLTSLSLELRASRNRQRQLQATWLARGAMERAEASLRANTDYTEETWKIAAVDFKEDAANQTALNSEDATVAISVRAGERESQKRVSIVATIGAGTKQTRCEKQIIVETDAIESEE